MKEVDIFKHSLVPKHTILKEDEVKRLLSRFNVSINQLPKISIKDPAVIRLEAKGGDILKIERKSETAGKSEYYRVVISG